VPKDEIPKYLLYATGEIILAVIGILIVYNLIIGMKNEKMKQV
jgi:hypothetical protein